MLSSGWCKKCNKSSLKSRLITIFHQNIWDKPVTGLAYLPGYDGMNNTTKKQLDGDLNAVSDFLLGRTAEISVFFLYNEKMEVATILKGGKKNEWDDIFL